jgi:hypothetical protein
VTQERDVLAQAHRDVQAALASARKLWGDEAGEETLVRTAEAFLVHLRELRRSDRAAPPEQSAPSPAPLPLAELPRSCPVCQGPLHDQRATKRGNQPDLKCRDRNCDGAIWLQPRTGSRR